MPQIILESVSRIYDVDSKQFTALDNVSLSIEKGEFVSIAGHSGTGKTTLLSVIGGIVKPTSGRLLFDGVNVYGLDSDGLSEYRSTRIGFMFQFASLFQVLTAKENLLFPVMFKPEDRRISPTDAERKAVDLLKAVGLGSKINNSPSQLSGGEQRRVAIARAFMNDPEVILADEPTGDLDEDTEQEMVSIFKRMHEENGVTFVLVTHNSDLAAQAQTRYRMAHGKIGRVV
jgi:ABC-type lipoprotein export system ATPase subunit